MKKHVITLLSMIVISALLVAGLGAYLKYEILKPMDLYQDKGIMELPFLLMVDDGLRYTLESMAQPEATEPSTEATEPSTEATEPSTEATEPTETEPPETQPPETEPPVTEPVPVEDSWFDDALFVGNSLTVGLREFGRLGNADYFCDVGLSVFSVLGAQTQDRNFEKTTLEGLLRSRQYGKVILNFGINEAGYNLDAILNKYQEVIDAVRRLQPDATIIIHGVMTTGRKKAAEAWYFTPDRVYEMNSAIKTLADWKTVYYIDVNKTLADEEGYMPDSWSGDGCHPYGTGYAEWAQWIKEEVGKLRLS